MKLLTDLLLKDAVTKDNPEGINQYSGGGGGSSDAGSGSSQVMTSSLKEGFRSGHKALLASGFEYSGMKDRGVGRRSETVHSYSHSEGYKANISVSNGRNKLTVEAPSGKHGEIQGHLDRRK